MKAILITGASGGMGLATAKHLVSLGYEVYGLDIKPVETFDHFHFIQTDVTKEESVLESFKAIQEKGINKSHIIIYIVDINDEHAEFKVRLMAQSFEFNFKQIIVVIGNKSDKASIYSSKNEEAIDDYCYGKRFIFNVISCSDTSKSEIENFMNGHVIKEYLTLYNK